MRMPSTQYRWPSLLMGFAAAACGAEVAEQAPVGESSGAITGGGLLQPFENTVTIPQNQSMPPHGASVSINGSCTGVKIGTRRFLTANHCLGNPSTIKITNGLTETPTTTYTVAAVYHHPSDDIALGLPTRCGDGSLCSTSYDIAVIDITANTPHIPVIPVAAIKVGGNVFSHMTGYGCDTVTPANEHKKQRGTMNTATPTVTDQDIHYIKDTGHPTGCKGDSGGPLYFWNNTSQSWFVGGVTSAGTGSTGGSTTFFTRVANVFEWINQPTCNSAGTCTVTPTTRLNDFVDQAAGFFMNAARGFCAASMGKTGEDESRDVKASYCDSPFGDISNNPPGWRLISSGGNTFKIVNRWTGKCLGVQDASGGHAADVRQYACDPVGVSSLVTFSRRWRFEQLSYHHAHQYHVVNVNSGKCLGAVSGVVNADVRQYDCANSSLQHWTFTR